MFFAPSLALVLCDDSTPPEDGVVAMQVDLTAYVEKHDFMFDAVLDEQVSNDEVLGLEVYDYQFMSLWFSFKLHHHLLRHAGVQSDY